MSSYFSSIIKNVKEFYSEINGSTLTGAIDVVVVEQEDGTLRSSPFHVRFGKMGVLKAKEKIVDIEINGLPVKLNMKLDDTGVAFFVEEIEDGEDDEDWIAKLATSPLPDQTIDWQLRKSGNLKPTQLFQPEPVEGDRTEAEVLARVVPDETPSKEVPEPEDVDDEGDDNDSTPESSRVLESAGRKGKLNKKKRKRRSQLRSRRGSKSNVFQIEAQTETETGDELFAMDDVTTHHDIQEDTPEIPRILQRSARHLSAPSNDVQDTVEPLHAVFLEEEKTILSLLTRTGSVSSDFHYFPDSSQLDEVDFDSLTAKPETAPVLTNSMMASDQLDTWRWGEPVVEMHQKQDTQATQHPTPTSSPLKVETENKQEEERKQASWLGGMFNRSSQVRQDSEGLYLDDVINCNDPEMRAAYIQPSTGPLEVNIEPTDPLDLSNIPRAGIDMPRDYDCESGNGPSLPMSPQTVVVTPPTKASTKEAEDLAALVSLHLPDLAVSLCGGLSDKTITPAQFSASLLTYTQFLEKIKESSPVLEDPSLVVRLQEKYVSWTTASPILLSLMFFKKPMPQDIVENILKDGLPVNLNLSAEEALQSSPNKKSGWFGWFGSSSGDEKEVKTEPVEIDIKSEPEDEIGNSMVIPGTPRKRLETETTSSDSDQGNKKRWKKTLRLTSEQLTNLNLQKGCNEVDFSVTTAFQGTSVCRCYIYLWHHTDKVVISDIDGTITKSDVLGHLLPMVGQDWAHSGVTDLFTKISSNGYHMLYLSARAIGQYSMTQGYLDSVRQGELCLPEGPVFLNPDSLLHAFKREVIDKNPEEFKIRCLKDIQNLFEGKNPFFAGYGNKPNDAYAYRAVGIPVSRIFTINPAGELKHELTQNFQTSYIEQSAAMLDFMFPSLGIEQGFDPEFPIQEFSSVGFWRDMVSDIDGQEVNSFLAKQNSK